MKRIGLIAVLLLALAATVPATELAAKDIAELKNICQALVGAQTNPDQSQPVFDRFRPYGRSELSVDKLDFVCGEGRCSGILFLRDDADVYISYPQTEHGPDRIDAVVLTHREKTLFSVGAHAGKESH